MGQGNLKSQNNNHSNGHVCHLCYALQPLEPEGSNAPHLYWHTLSWEGLALTCAWCPDWPVNRGLCIAYQSSMLSWTSHQ